MTESQRQSAIDNTRERLEVLIALASHQGYPLRLEQKAIDIVDAVLALTKDRPDPVFPWPSSFPRSDFAPDDEQMERLR